MLSQGEMSVRTCGHCGTDNEYSHSFCTNCGNPLVSTSTQLEVIYGGFWRRFVAYILDAIILSILTWPLTMISATVSANGLSALISIIYFIGFWVWEGRTPGKMALGVKVVTAEGESPSLGRAILRYFGYMVSAIILCIGFLWIAWDGQKQGIHDKIAGTYVIKNK
ncbi:MAG: RDD family protein [Chloroflexota bacterium]|nr:RDD family protein [Chloroflexota bacterium]